MKYNYSDFFINLSVIIAFSLGMDLILYYVSNFPLSIILEDLWPMVIRSILIAAFSNLFLNLNRVYELLQGIESDSKKDDGKKLVKVKTQYRQVPLNRKRDTALEGLTT